MKTKIRLLALLLSSFSFSVFAFLNAYRSQALASPNASPQKANKSKNQTKPELILKLGLNWKAEPQFGGFFAADQLGLFKKAGLNIELIEGGSGTPTLQALLSGRLDYAVVSADELVVAHSQGRTQAQAIFATFQNHPQCIMAHATLIKERSAPSREKLFRSLMQDSSLTLQWQQGLPYAQYLSAKLGDEIKIKRVPYAGGLTVFRRDTKMLQQCFVSSEPILAKQLGLEVEVFAISEMGFNPYGAVLATTEGRLLTKKEEVAKVVKVVRTGWEAYLKNPAKVNEWIQKKSPGLSAQFLEESAKIQASLIRPEAYTAPLGEMRVSRWMILSEQMLDSGVIKTAVSPEKLFQNF
jgi:NitT/TauT family transport system substrate-binding protein